MADDRGYDPSVWRRMCDELGLAGLVIPENLGGGGGSAIDLLVAFEEMGTVLLCAPYLASTMAANLLLALAADSAGADGEEYLPDIAGGHTIATVALAEQAGRWDEAGVTTEATQTAGGWRLTGEKWYVLDGHVADLLLVVARAPAGVSVFAVSAGAPGCVARPLATLDQTRKLATVSFDRTPARLIGAAGAAWPSVSRMLDRTMAALAAEQVGGAQRVLDMAVDYAKLRVQFGRPIGGFQAIKHKCADVLVEVESARSTAYYAAWTAAADAEEAPVAACLAKATCSVAYSLAAAENIQVHGGIGFTWEHPAHLYFKRARGSELLLGDVAHHRELLAKRIGV